MLIISFDAPETTTKRAKLLTFSVYKTCMYIYISKQMYTYTLRFIYIHGKPSAASATRPNGALWLKV